MRDISGISAPTWKHVSAKSSYDSILAEMRRRAFPALIPPERKPLSQFIEDSIVLPEGLCAVPGPMQLYPYQREIADAIGDDSIERVTLQKGIDEDPGGRLADNGRR